MFSKHRHFCRVLKYSLIALFKKVYRCLASFLVEMSRYELKQVSLSDYVKLLQDIKKEVLNDRNDLMSTTVFADEIVLNVNYNQTVISASEETFHSSEVNDDVTSSEKLRKVVEECMELQEKANTEDLECTLREFNDLQHSLTSYVSNINDKIHFLRANAKKLKTLIHDNPTEENSIVLNKSVHREFAEVIQMMPELCANIEESEELMKGKLHIDWEKLIQVMRKITEDKKTKLEDLSKIESRIKEIKKIVDL